MKINIKKIIFILVIYLIYTNFLKGYYSYYPTIPIYPNNEKGLLISGGVDSTIIASLVREKVGSNKNIYAYCYSSDDSDDESEFARKVSNQLNLKTKYLKQDRDSLSYINRLKKIVKNLGRGHSSPAIVSIDYLYEHANNDGLKVILDGQGADELLAGYKLYHFDLIFQQLMKLNFKQSYLNLKADPY